jgi:vesicle-fusing ATPase
VTDFSALTGGTASTSVPVLVEAKGYIYFLEADARVAAKKVGFNTFQRECALITLGETVTIISAASIPLPPLSVLRLSVDFISKPAIGAQVVEISDEKLDAAIRNSFTNHVFAKGQAVAIDVEARKFKLSVLSVSGLDVGTSAKTLVPRGTLLSGVTELEFQTGEAGGLRVLTNKAVQRQIFRPDFNFEDLGIGGLTKEFGDIFRRAFASRVFPPKVIREWGINHVRGMLLWGPPGTGKTLIARQLAKFLKAREPKIVNGPEILDKYVGASESKIRDLFADAEKEYKKEGENSQLHIIILDELDAICKQRGSNRDGTGVHDSIVNQLLSKIDGVDSLNNILLIGMTNRYDMIDEALLRPGRLEVHVEISLPDEVGRREIFNIHTRKMRENKRLSPDVDLGALARHSKNFSGAEIEGLVRSASSYSLNRMVNFKNAAQTISPADYDKLVLTNDDFLRALEEVKPAFGAHEEDISRIVRHGILRYSHAVDVLLGEIQLVVSHVINSVGKESGNVSDISSLLLTGPDGSGKSAFACNAALSAGFPFVRVISPDAHVGMSETTKINDIRKVFEDAYKSSLSCIILDDLERLTEYLPIGPRFSNGVLQALFALIKKPHPKPGRKLLIIATAQTNFQTFMDDVGMTSMFDSDYQVPLVSDGKQAEIVIRSVNPTATDSMIGSLSRLIAGEGMPVKKLIRLAEMARDTIAV